MTRPATPWSRARSFAALLVLVVLVGALDYATGTEIAFSIFFLIPIAAGAWFLGRTAGLALAGLSALAWFLADRYGGFPYTSPTIPFWNACVGLGSFSIVAVTLAARRRAERRLFELMEARSEFASTVSHELRTPLTCVKEGIDLVLDGSAAALGREPLEHLRTAKRNVDRLTRLVNDVLTLQKLEARRLEIQRAPCDLGELVRQATADLALVAGQRGLELTAEVEPALPLVRCDADRIRLALDNLLANALNYGERGRIRVRAQAVEGGVRLSVADQGPGIRAEDVPKLFRGFSQLAAPPVKRAEGTGLGLAIVRRIVELHGGSVGVDSTPGHGATFHFTLPAPGACAGPSRSRWSRRRAAPR